MQTRSKIFITVGCLLGACTIAVPVTLVTVKACTTQKKFFDKWEEYIWDRTFSIKIDGDAGTVRGTFWIISDATNNDVTDFKYWIATNWHVMNQISTKTTQVSFSLKQNKIGWDDYIPFKSFEQESNDKFYFNKSENQIIDLAVAKVDMENQNEKVNESLNRLNKRQKETGSITDFADASTDRNHFENKQMYTAGFPENEKTENVEWQANVINQYNMEYFGLNKLNHKVFDKIDISPRYRFKYSKPLEWMDSGASGSMLLCDFDGTVKVCGIYWGGYLNSSETEFYPCFSIFNSSTKNFISEYI